MSKGGFIMKLNVESIMYKVHRTGVVNYWCTVFLILDVNKLKTKSDELDKVC